MVRESEFEHQRVSFDLKKFSMKFKIDDLGRSMQKLFITLKPIEMLRLNLV